MVVTYKNNRIVPACLITICILAVFYLVDPSVENYGFDKPELVTTETDRTGRLPETLVVPVQSTPDTDTRPSSIAAGNHGLAEDDVVLLLKTGGTTLWKRLLIHLTTSVASERIKKKNVGIYSDFAESIAGFEIIDALANVSATTKARADFEIYHQQPEYEENNYYVEASGVNGDEWGPIGGWIIDKYKFVPLMDHAGQTWPEAKWYIYMEDDAYIFLPNVLSYLSTFDWQQPHYLGHFSGKSDVIFAHGGAGFALSRGAWEKSFGHNSRMAEDWDEYTADHCCGDQVLGAALKDHGINFGENGGDGLFTFGFNPVVHWSFAFSRSNWCRPLYSWHKVHSRDIARYYELEQMWDFSKGPLLYKDFFIYMILPHIQTPREWWDNMAGLYEVTSANKDAPPEPESRHDAELWKKAWASKEACEQACLQWEECMSWTFVEDMCRMDDKLTMGQGFAPSMSQRKTSLKHTSGWAVKRLEQWAC